MNPLFLMLALPRLEFCLFYLWIQVSARAALAFNKGKGVEH